MEVSPGENARDPQWSGIVLNFDRLCPGNRRLLMASSVICLCWGQPCLAQGPASVIPDSNAWVTDPHESKDLSSPVVPPAALNGSGAGDKQPAPVSVIFESTVRPLPLDFKPHRSDQFSINTNSGYLLDAGMSGRQAREALFKHHDVVVVIDKSSSMAVQDCPGGQSRWEWCREQTASLAKAATQMGEEGIRVVVFSDDHFTYPGSNLDRVAHIFNTNFPNGGTDTAAALSSVLNDYFRMGFSDAKPLVVAVITDGRPNDPDRVKEVIAAATRKIRDPNQVSLTFLQVGEDLAGMAFARDVDFNLLGRGASFDIVQSKTFDQLKRGGVIGALLDAIARRTVPEPAPDKH